VGADAGHTAGCLWLQDPDNQAQGEAARNTSTTGHVWDGDLVELNNPLPRWWLWLFWITGIYMIGYLIVYPGLGNFAGIGG
jgi:cytochrome c oxidase cbb3-type subunit 3